MDSPDLNNRMVALDQNANRHDRKLGALLERFAHCIPVAGTVVTAALRRAGECGSPSRMDIALPEDPRIPANENQGTSADIYNSLIYAPKDSRDPRKSVIR